MESSDDKVGCVQSILVVLEGLNDDSSIITGLEILIKLIKNILKSPHEEKFRNIKKTNKAISTKLLSLSGIEDLILALGYKDDNDEFYVFDIDKYSDLYKLKRAIQEFHDEKRKKYMTPEELEKFEILQEQKRKFYEDNKKKAKARKDLENGMKFDREEKNQEEIKSSKANHLNFGANVVKFQPPAPASR
eukprot:CAMPEP_0196996226 /NCGR_PEP_ID=MMETSP1380-20130617/2159_1 /TAXON_ID=5936 /ORGANISM="Euplotes crassus, Strain CT5" /LENGTH=189 /DNA_ID=CAMNT_0042412123 /DNA_START=1 /DNA_END=570 /DNA_ORIENTATION=-